MWRDCDVVIEGDVTAQLAVLQFVSAAGCSARHNVSIPAKTLSGFALSSHVFWDTEILSFPSDIYSTTSSTQLAVLPLPYSGRARRKASEAGYEGRCSLGSASTGDEVTPLGAQPGWQADPIWCGDNHTQR